MDAIYLDISRSNPDKVSSVDRPLETVEDTLRRQAQNKTSMASMRASETHEQTLRIQEQDRICTASMIIMAGLNACGLQSKLLITPLSIGEPRMIPKLLLPCVLDTMIM